MKPLSDRFRSLPLVPLSLAILYLFGVPVVYSQASSALTGIVTTPEGKPILGVIVFGSESKKCCPFKREQTKTDNSGRFTLQQPGAVIHFLADKFQPKSWVVPTEAHDSRFVLEPETKPFFIANCKNTSSDLHRIPGGKSYGLQFDVPKKGFAVTDGKPDVDYVRFVIRPKGSSSYLELWFGPYAFSSDPGDERYLDSVSFSERNVAVEGGNGWGYDVSGELRTGERWRHTYIGPGNGVRYQASSADLAALDRIVNSACYVPPPRER